jgi:phospholipid transport system substrate-binding protein
MIRFVSPQTLRSFPGVLATACLLLFAWSPQPSLAAAQEPQIMVRQIFDKLLTQLDEQEQEHDGTISNARVREIFVSLLSPHIAYQTLAHWVLRNYWADSSPDQQAAFIDAFEEYIINTYALALSNGQAIQLDVKDDPVVGSTTAVVSATFKTDDSDPVPIDFRLVLRDGKWLLFDVSLSGVSLARTFRADFTFVAKNGGIDAVTEHLVRRRQANSE